MSEHPIVHIEFSADDREAAGQFYSELFGWKVSQIPDSLDLAFGRAARQHDPTDGTPRKPYELIDAFPDEKDDPLHQCQGYVRGHGPFYEFLVLFIRLLKQLDGKTVCPRLRFCRQPVESLEQSSAIIRRDAVLKIRIHLLGNGG